VETGWSLHQVSILVEGDASFGDGGIEVGEGLEVLVDDRLVDEGPEGSGGLQFGRIEPAPDLIRGGAGRPA
jgi:hypothetical protein